ncbi:DUF4261 domain-containing protein [Prosthecobacter sp.]|uniref:DUF4261 domain-containing protein n=1 Tax=Prosthecobacter sp. TaxID=1965333 RepID=UPI00390477FE
MEELRWLLDLATLFADLPEAVAFFNPNGEVIMRFDELAEFLEDAHSQTLFPVQAVIATRGYRIDESWSLVDSVGMAQFGLSDHEFAISGATIAKDETILFLLNLVHYQIDKRVEIGDRHTTDGPGGKVWRAEERGQACLLPPRKVLHWKTEDAPPEPELLARKEEDVPQEQNVDEGAPNPLDAVVAEMAAKTEAWLVHRDAIRARAVAWLRSPAFRTAFYDDAHVPFAMKIAMEQGLKRKEAAQAWQQAQALGVQSPQLWQQYQHLATRGQVVFANAVISNPAFSSEPNASLPCALVMSHDQSAMQITMTGLLAGMLQAMYRGEDDGKAYPKLIAIICDDEFRLFRRDALPLEETDGQKCTLLAVQLRKSWMPPPEVPFVPLLMLPGTQGAVVQIPWHVVTGTPPVPGSMKPGRWAEVAELDRQADRMVAVQKTEKAGCYTWFSRIVQGVFLLGILMGLYIHFVEGDTRPGTTKPTGSSQSAASPKTVSTVSSWTQAPSLKSKFNRVSASAYEPLIGEDAAGSGFLFDVPEGLILAATSRHQFASVDQSPAKLFDLDDLEVSLNTQQVIRQPESQVQIVTGVTKIADCLEYNSADTLVDGSALRLILGKGQWVEGRLTLTGTHVLSSRARVLRMTVKTLENVAGSSGSPIVQALSGRVVGVMQGADKAEGPSFIEFETISVRLGPKK